MLDIAVADGLKAVFYAPPVNRRLDFLKEVATSELTILGVSDGGAHTKFFTGGRYPTEMLTKLVRDNEIMSLEEMHWRLSTQPAMCAGFQNRDRLPVGEPGSQPDPD